MSLEKKKPVTPCQMSEKEGGGVGHCQEGSGGITTGRSQSGELIFRKGVGVIARKVAAALNNTRTMSLKKKKPVRGGGELWDVGKSCLGGLNNIRQYQVLQVSGKMRVRIVRKVTKLCHGSYKQQHQDCQIRDVQWAGSGKVGHCFGGLRKFNHYQENSSQSVRRFSETK
jgi:hypothetical protein